MTTITNKNGKYVEILTRFKAGVLLLGNGAVANGDFSLWGFWIGSAILAALIALLCYIAGNHSAEYTQFIAGQITWRAASKAQDYYLLLGLIFGFLATLLMFLFLAGWIRKRIAPSAVVDFHTLIVFASLPAIIWLGRLFLSRDTSLSLLALSPVLIILVLLFTLFAILRAIRSEDSLHFSDVVSSSVLIIVWSGLSALALILAASRLKIVLNLGTYLSARQFTCVTVLVTAIFGVSLLISVWFRRAIAGDALRSRLRLFVILAQAVAPWFFLILLPTPWIKDGRRFYGYPMRPAVWIVIGLFVLIAYVDLVRRWKPRPSATESYVTSALSPMCLIGLLLYVKVAVVGGPTIHPDDYHFGEFLLPWWSWSAHHMIPFWDFAPSRGLINYVLGFLSSVLFGGTPASFHAAAPFVAAIYLVFCYPFIAKSIGVVPTFLAFLLMPLANGVHEIDMVMTAGLCILCELYLRGSPSSWLITWMTVGTLVVLVAPGQGGLLVIATTPLGVIATRDAIRNERAKLLKSIGTFGIALAVLSIFTPFGKMLAGAVRYGIEQSSINSIANGVEWSHSWNPAGTVRNQWLWEGARASWILVAIVAGVLILRSAVGWHNDRRRRLLVFAIPIFVLLVLFILRAAGRIDPLGMSRLGIASIWALSLLLPILLIAAYGKERRALVLTTWLFLAAILSVDFSALNLRELLNRSAEVVEAPVTLVKGKELGLANLGDGIFDASHLKRLLSIGHVLNGVVEPGETYLDLTNRSAHYFYFGFRPPIEEGAVYNMVNERQQYRAIKEIERRPPPIVLASADNFVHDGGTVAYRSHLLYRYVVVRYVPVKIDELIYLVRSDRLPRVAEYLYTQDATGDESRMSLLDSAFRMPFIEELPVAWGRSLRTLTPELRQVQVIGSDIHPELNSVGDIGKGYYQIEGPNPSLTFDISAWNLAGADAGILTFDFSCKGASGNPQVKIYWGTRATPASETTMVRFVADNGSLVVPLDAAPRWLLAKDISSLKFEITDPGPCTAFSITNIKLWQRTAADKLPR